MGADHANGNPTTADGVELAYQPTIAGFGNKTEPRVATAHLPHAVDFSHKTILPDVVHVDNDTTKNRVALLSASNRQQLADNVASSNQAFRYGDLTSHTHRRGVRNNIRLLSNNVHTSSNNNRSLGWDNHGNHSNNCHGNHSSKHVNRGPHL